MSVFGDAGRRHRVAVLVRDGVLPMELGLVHQLFGTAVSPAGELLYEVVSCALAPGEVRTDADFSVTIDHGPGTLAEADTVVLPASHEQDEVPGPLPGPLADALELIGPDTRIATICTAAFVLAAAGLLEGLPATTHWQSGDRFRAWYPDVALDCDVLYTESGRVLTSAGEAAGIDLCLHMIRNDHGAAVANEVARRTVVPPHRDGGQAQYIPRPIAAPGASSTGRARAWALEHLDRPLTLRDLAARESTSVRTFTRRFREEVGTSANRWLTRQRIERARHLLEATDLPVDHVAEQAGFGTAASLRQHLQAALGVSPSAYRSTFRG
ncbi:GlxA family transcriptional regulator [Actinomadura rugatobispora]|uniref:GlxA family transcriptional regulator n=1 Tax=Actinomadura rugatobispora TaxID=1994 RepID=A0ABW0ZW22_9ACTN|nr:helix-turn-helix domain-containing protein [Actinomadura rugatobispora]